ncbi:MAG: MerR family transcriptional regulator [Proteobacteria bacterium]|nr:MAG: MerR family transcriptional regulator [Pseudomonadota bacterium]
MLSISQFAKAGKVGVETIRFYQRKGLLKVPQRGTNAMRYGEEDLSRLHFVRMAQTAGFTLQEIKELIALESTEDRRRVRELASSRIAALDLKILELQEARNQLKMLALECEEGGSGPCPIISAFS